VEVPAGVVGGDPASRSLLARDRRFELLDIALAPLLGRQPGDAGLQDGPYLQTPHDRIQAKVGDAEAAIGERVDQPLASEPPQRLAHGRA
jgi:hypothetical protein